MSILQCGGYIIISHDKYIVVCLPGKIKIEIKIENIKNIKNKGTVKTRKTKLVNCTVLANMYPVSRGWRDAVRNIVPGVPVHGLRVIWPTGNRTKLEVLAIAI
jgi:hypothetical protein